MTDSAQHMLNAEALSADLRTSRIGRRIVVLPDVDSTNTYALQTVGLVEGPNADGFVVFAELQSRGRGRLGRQWVSPRGAGLTFTALLYERLPALTASRYVMAAAVAVARAVSVATDVEPVIRWPNDVYVKTRKLAGILVEARSFESGAWLVAIGIGLNCLQQPGHFPPDLRDRVTSLDMESREPIDRTAVARELLRQLDRQFSMESRSTRDALIADWRSWSADIGQHVRLQQGDEVLSGRIVDIDPQAELLVQLDTGGRRTFDAMTTSRI